ncbi:MAG: glucosaminidase domain-containing protein [Bacteroidales bacterium]|nr:glucosaminidase domain-containing protein [Bacteroidales bacterium]
MKRIVSILLVLVLAVAATESDFEKYIKKYSPIAVSEMQRTGVPASITLAQGLVESAAGKSTLASKSNNHFGIKCHSDWKGRKTYKDDDKAMECFRVYSNANASFKDHSDFLRYQDRYKFLFDLDPTDYKAWARGLKQAGYATDPKYADKLIKVIEDYSLYRFDKNTEDIPEPPLAIEQPVVVSRAEAREEVRFSLTRNVFEINGVPCIYAVEGDTYASLAASNGLFEGEILRFNDRLSSTELKPGEIVFLQAKKNKAARGVPKYIAGPDGASLRDIAQRFGVRLAAICRYNGLPGDCVPLEGDTILLRRK